MSTYFVQEFGEPQNFYEYVTQIYFNDLIREMYERISDEALQLVVEAMMMPSWKLIKPDVEKNPIGQRIIREVGKWEHSKPDLYEKFKAKIAQNGKQAEDKILNIIGYSVNLSVDKAEKTLLQYHETYYGGQTIHDMADWARKLPSNKWESEWMGIKLNFVE